MSCVQVAPGVIVNMADNRFLRKVIQYCPVDECKTEMVARHEAWYGTSYYCCKCGDSWCDGEMYPRPFARGWRKSAVRRARELWDQASHGPPPRVEQLYPEYDEPFADVDLPASEVS